MISKSERNLLELTEANLLPIAFLAVLILSIVIRFFQLDLVSSDASGCLLPWYENICRGGATLAERLSLQIPDCNYTIPYMSLVAILSCLPLEPLFAYKLSSMIFDYLLAALVARIAYVLVDTHKRETALYAFSAVILCPEVFLNSAAWAQCDAMYTFFIIGALYLLIEAKYKTAMILYGIAFAVKLQSCFVLPFFLFYYFSKKRFSILYFLLIPVPMVVLSLPALFCGRDPMALFSVYSGNIQLYPYMYMNYPSIWSLFDTSGWGGTSYHFFVNAAIYCTIAVLGLLIVSWVRKKLPLTRENSIYTVFLLSYTAVLFLPSMHERYGFVYDILAILVAVAAPVTLPLLCGLSLIALMTYGSYLCGTESPKLAGWNFAIYLMYLILLSLKMSGKSLSSFVSPLRDALTNPSSEEADKTPSKKQKQKQTANGR